MILSATIAQTSPHLNPFISDLGLILMTAGVAVLLFKKIKQPLVLGYLIAGFLAGPYFHFFPSIRETGSIEVWAEIGVIFLLFSLGLEFSFKRLLKVGGRACITAFFEILSMIFLGYMTGIWLGWSQMDSIFLGATLSISSTTIILRAFDELNVKCKKYASIVLGVLIIEDIVAIILLVLLSTIAVNQDFSGAELVGSVLKLCFFLIIWFIAGIYIIPTILKRGRKLFTEETLLLLALALCLMMVTLATKVGFSPALGAFIMGSIIAETTQAERIENLIKPVKDLFGAIFFVSVGMLINPDTLIEHAVPVVIITLVTVFGKTGSTIAGALLSGQPLRQSVQSGMSLAQIGEFSYIIAALGMSLKVTSGFLYPIVVAVSAITTFTTPYLIKFSLPAYEKLVKIFPQKWIIAIEKQDGHLKQKKIRTNWQLVVRAKFSQIVINAVIIIAIMLLSDYYLLPMVKESDFWSGMVVLVTSFTIAPFLWALALRKVAIKPLEILNSEKKNRIPLLLLKLLQLGTALFLIGFLLHNFFSLAIALYSLVVCAAIFLLFPRKLRAQYATLENHFLENFNDRKIAQGLKNRTDLAPWDGHMTFFNIAKESNLSGKTLQELQLRKNMGINIAFIKRGEIMINIPSGSERIFPGDEIYLIGTDTQIHQFKCYLDQSELSVPHVSPTNEIVLKHFLLKDEELIGKTIGQSQLLEKTCGLVVGIEKNGQRILNPESQIILEKDDIIWIVGDKKLLSNLN